MRFEARSFVELLAVKVRMNLKAEASRTYLSFLWWLLEPALLVIVLYVVFSVFLNRGTEHFVVFLLCGLIPFQWFSKSVSNCSMCIRSGAGLINQIYIPKVFFPLVVIFQDLFKALITIALFLVFVILYGMPLHLTWLAIPALVLVQLLVNATVAIFVAMVVPFIPDLRFLVSTALLLMMYGSGIFYSYKDVLLEEHQAIFLMNPIANIIRLYREVIIDNAWPDWTALLLISLVSVCFLCLFSWILHRNDSRYARLVLE